MRKRAQRLVASSGLTIALLVATAVPAVAHEPVEGVAFDARYKPGDLGGEETYRFSKGTSQQGWVFGNIIYIAPANVDAPDISYDLASANQLWMVPWAEIPDRPCDRVRAWEEEGIRINACTTYRPFEGQQNPMTKPRGKLRAIWFNDERVWCQRDQRNRAPANWSGCWSVKRTALHEFGHVLGLSRQWDGKVHPDRQPDGAKGAQTVMYAIKTPRAGSQLHLFGPCDVIRLQMMYGVEERSGRFGNCVDHLGAATLAGQLKATLSMTASWTKRCDTTALVMRGELRLADALTELGKINRSELEGRTVQVFKRPFGGTWETTATASRVVASNATWSATMPSAVGVWEYQARFSGAEAEVNSATSATVAVDWSPDVCPSLTGD